MRQTLVNGEAMTCRFTCKIPRERYWLSPVISCTVSNSYSAYNLTSPGFPICPTHIAYLNQEGGHFCTSYNSYVAPHTLLSVVSTVPLTSTIVTTTEAQITVTVTTTVSAVLPTSLKKRDGTSVEEIAIETYMVIYPEKNTADTSATITIHLTNNGLAKRTAVPTPSSILDWQATRIASACSQVATGTVTDYTVGEPNFKLCIFC